MAQKGYKKHQLLNDRLFWRCYRVERNITAILYKRVEIPFQAIVASIVGISVLLTTIPGVVLAESQGFSLIETNLEPIHPVIGVMTTPFAPFKKMVEVVGPIGEDEEVFYGVLPQSSLREPTKTVKGVVTFYCSEPRYTDSTPFITANGTHVRFGIAASNIVRFNTKVLIPEVFGDTSFVVMDRMNSRYNHKPFFDIWLPTCDEARERGVHYTTVEIY